MLDPRFDRLTHIFILGSKGWAAVRKIRTDKGLSISETLERAGKTVLNLPHPSGQKQEYVRLASLSGHQFPSLDQYVSERWMEYRLRSPCPRRKKETEAIYKAKRATVWKAIDILRKSISGVRPPP
jgi:hypothetical protein